MSKIPVARKTKSGKPSVATIASLGVERLAELLMAAARADPLLMRSLTLEIAGEGGDIAAALDREIARVQKSKGLLNPRKAVLLARELSVLVEAVITKLGPKDPAGGAERLLGLLALGSDLIERLTDDGDALATVFRGLSLNVGALLERTPDGAAKSGLIDSAYRIYVADNYGLAEELIGRVACVVGADDRRKLKALVEAD